MLWFCIPDYLTLDGVSGCYAVAMQLLGKSVPSTIENALWCQLSAFLRQKNNCDSVWCLSRLTCCQVTSRALFWLAAWDRCRLQTGWGLIRVQTCVKSDWAINAAHLGGSGLSDFSISITATIKLSNQLWPDLSTCHITLHITSETRLIKNNNIFPVAVWTCYRADFTGLLIYVHAEGCWETWETLRGRKREAPNMSKRGAVSDLETYEIWGSTSFRNLYMIIFIY